MSRFKAAQKQYTIRTLPDQPSSSSSTSSLQPAPTGFVQFELSHPKPAPTGKDLDGLMRQRQDLDQKIEAAVKRMQTFDDTLGKWGCDLVTHRGPIHVKGPDSGRLTAQRNGIQSGIQSLRAQLNSVLNKINPERPLLRAQDKESDSLRRQKNAAYRRMENGAIDLRMLQAAQVYDNWSPYDDFRASEDREFEKDREFAKDREDEQQRQALNHFYTIKRQMAGIIPAIEGTRCYHINEQGLYDPCDCIVISRGVFKVDVSKHPEGSYYLDETVLNRQKNIMNATGGKALNRGGFLAIDPKMDQEREILALRVAAQHGTIQAAASLNNFDWPPDNDPRISEDLKQFRAQAGENQRQEMPHAPGGPCPAAAALEPNSSPRDNSMY